MALDDPRMRLADAFMSDGNEVVDLRLIRTPDDLNDESLTFRPEMSHQVFGEKECIFGYSDLKIKIYFAAASLVPYLSITYAKKVDLPGVKADELRITLMESLGLKFVTNKDMFILDMAEDEKFHPFGELIHSATVKKEEDNSERVFEVYMCDVFDKEFLRYHSRLQSFLIWFVDAASFVDTDDDRWRFFVVYEKYKRSDGKTMYASAGYTSVYEYYAYPENMRPRMSQVIVLPPFRRLGLCSFMVEAVYKYYARIPKVIDITVEDPSEDFQRVRDFVDCVRCMELPVFSDEKLKGGFTAEMEEEARKKLLINKKQVRRIYEILYLNSISESNEKEFKEYRLTVKRRLNLPYQKQQKYLNRCKALMTPQEVEANLPSLHNRISKLNEMFEDLIDEYRQVITRLTNHN